MWLAELLGQEIGMEAHLRNASSTSWICDPHKAVNVAPLQFLPSIQQSSQVPFQGNHYDCGVHTLWHLRHVLQFREVNISMVVPKELQFTNDMVAKRLRLAQEILDDAGL